MRLATLPILRPCSRAEARELGHARHRAVVVHDLADHARGLQPGEPGEIDRALGLPGADEHAALARAEREDVARAREVLRASSVGSMATWIVCARSAAEIPVEIPRRRVDRDRERRPEARSCSARTAGGARARRTSAPSSARQMSPRPKRAMKLIASGVTFSAAMQRSPSFSRFSSSTRTTIRPARISSRSSSTGAKTPDSFSGSVRRAGRS